MKEHYEDYWSRPDMYSDPDPLTELRINALWDVVATSSSPTPRLLDVGCGEGDLVADALNRGLDAVGLDISELAVERARKRHPAAEFVAHPVDQQPWPVETESFDVVASFEVIEHLLHPTALVRGAKAALKPGGLIVLSTPYHGVLKNLALVVTSFDKHFAVEGDHIRFFTDAALRSLLESSGFEVLGFRHLGRTWGLWANSIVWARKRQS